MQIVSVDSIHNCSVMKQIRPLFILEEHKECQYKCFMKEKLYGSYTIADVQESFDDNSLL